jgi:GTP1/Obg family GTP-binding protein
MSIDQLEITNKLRAEFGEELFKPINKVDIISEQEAKEIMDKMIERVGRCMKIMDGKSK